MSDVLSFFDTVSWVSRFLEAAFHLILYYRQVYPANRKLWNVEVKQSRHPALTEYIGKAIKSVSEELKKRTLLSVSLVIKTADVTARPLERFVFETEWFLSRDRLPAEPEDFVPNAHGISASDAEHYFRAFIAKISAADAYLTPLPENITFAVVVQLEEGSAPPPEAIPGHTAKVPWVPADESDVPTSRPLDSENDRRATAEFSTMPVKTTRFGMLNLGLNVIEWDAKAAAREAEFLSSGEVAVQDRDREESGTSTPRKRVDKGKRKAVDW